MSGVTGLAGLHPYHLEINLTKTKWQPKQVEDVVDVLNHAFERSAARADIEPIMGTDHITEWALKNKEDIAEFLGAQSMMQEAFAEKIVRFREPRPRIMPKKWVPKKVKILAHGNLVSKYFGEDTMSTREVCTSLKIYDCGHYYLKQTLPGSGPVPYWNIFEGRWEETEKGLRLIYQLRYSWQPTTKMDPAHSIECQPPGFESSLAWVNDSLNVLNGLIPAIVGDEKFGRVEIVREPDKVGKSEIRWNEDLLDEDDPRRIRSQNAEGPKIPGANRGSGSAANDTEPKYKLRPQWAEMAAEAPSADAGGVASSSSSCAPARPTAAASEDELPTQPPHAAGAVPTRAVEVVAEEPHWPFSVCLVIFTALFLSFTKTWWEAWRSEPDHGFFEL